MARQVVGNNGSTELFYNPYQVQFLDALDAVHEDGTRFFHRYGLFAGRRGGKTRIGAVAAIKELTRKANVWGWACAPSYPELNDYVMPAVFAALPRRWFHSWSEEHKELRLVNGSLLQFRSLDDPERGRGPGLDFAWLDEARKIQKKAWDTLRPALTERKGIAWFTTSPNAFDWCYRFLWKRGLEGKAGHWACKYKTKDNPIISEAELQEARETLDPLFYQQEYEADFVSFAGAIYGEYLQSCVLSTIDEVQEWLPEYDEDTKYIDPSRPVVIGIDVGTDHPFAAVKIVATTRGLVVCGEYTRRGGAASEHALEIQALEGGAAEAMRGIDKSAAGMAIELAQHGVYTQGAPNAVTVGIQRVRSWFRAKRLVIVEDLCPQLCEQMRGYRWADHDRKDGQLVSEKVYKLDDDLPDALRYGVMTWPELPTPATDLEGRQVRVASDVPADLRWAWEREQRIKRGEMTGEDWRDLDETPWIGSGLGDFYDDGGDDTGLGDFYN